MTFQAFNPFAQMTAEGWTESVTDLLAQPASGGMSHATHAARNGTTVAPAPSASTRSAKNCSALFRSAASSMWL